jgi:hypothetical protein
VLNPTSARTYELRVSRPRLCSLQKDSSRFSKGKNKVRDQTFTYRLSTDHAKLRQWKKKRSLSSHEALCSSRTCSSSWLAGIPNTMKYEYLPRGTRVRAPLSLPLAVEARGQTSTPTPAVRRPSPVHPAFSPDLRRVPLLRSTGIRPSRDADRWSVRLPGPRCRRDEAGGDVRSGWPRVCSAVQRCPSTHTQ